MSLLVSHCNTATAPQGRAIQYWNEQMRERVMDLSIDSVRRRDFRGAITSYNSERLRLSLIQVQHRQQVLHERRQASVRSGKGQFLLLHMRAGEIFYEGRSHSVHLNTGDCLLISDSEGFRFESTDNTTTMVMRFDQDWLRHRIPGVDEQVGKLLPGSQSWGATLSSAMQNVDPRNVAPEERWQVAVADQISSLICLLTDHSTPAHGKSSRALYERITTLMQARYEDPELNPAGVAMELGISRRYLHGVIAGFGSSFNRELYRIRLQQARLLLESNAHAHLSVAEVAYACGFASAAHFSRVFKARYACTPTSCRRKA